METKPRQRGRPAGRAQRERAQLSGVPSSIAAQLVAVNESVRSMPSMTLLQNRLGRVHELQTEAIHGPWSGHHICSNIDAQYWGVACHPDGSRSTWR